MLRWLWKIIVGAKPVTNCARDCQWEIIDRGLIGRGAAKEQCGTWYVLQCSTCGLLKNHENY